MPFLSGWGKRKPIKYGTVFPGSNLTGFPELLVVSGDTDIATELASGGGVAFTLADGTTTIPFGFYPSSAPASGDIITRFKVDPLTAATTGDVMAYIYYDAAQTTSENKAGVMDGNYRLFAPLDEDPSGPSPQMRDWVTDTLSGTADSGVTTAAGQVGSAVDTPAGEYVRFPVAQDSAVTVELIGKLFAVGTGAFGAFGRMVESGSETVSDRALGLLTSANAAFEIYDGSAKTATGSSTLSLDTVYWLAGTADGTTVRVYVDGVLDGSTAGGAPYTSFGTPLFRLGDVQGHCLLDEVRVSSVARSADWLAYAYANDGSNPSTVTLGAEETSGGGGGFFGTPLFAILAGWGNV